MKSVTKGSGRSRGGMRSRSSGGRRGGTGNNLYDSNGPGSVRIKGSPSQIYERYVALAKEGSVTGDRVHSESLSQHAEHYLRLQNIRERNKEKADSEKNGGKSEISSRRSPWNKKRTLPSTRFEVNDEGRKKAHSVVDNDDVEKQASKKANSNRDETPFSEDEYKQGLRNFLSGPGSR